MIRKFKKIFQEKSEVYLSVKVRPNADKTCIKEIMSNETIKVNLAAAPERGKANKELIKFLAKQFGIITDNVKIISGAGERLKLVKIIKQ